MTLIRRYIILEFLRFFLLSFIGIVSVSLCVEFLQKADDFIKYQAAFRDMLGYFLLSIPSIATPSFPIAALLATLLSLGNLSRHNEITAMHAGGVGIGGIVAPVFLAGAVLSAAGFVNNELIMPPSSARANVIRYQKIEKKRHLVIFQMQNLWLRGPDNSFVNVEITPPDRYEMIGVSIYRMNPDFTVRERIRAQRLVLEEGVWRLREGTKVTLGKDGVVSSPVDGDVFNIVESPEDLRMISKFSEEMSFTELWEYVRRLKSSGLSTTRYEVDLHKKLSFPLSSLVMVLIATPLSLLRVRSGGIGKSVGISIAVAFAYWAVMSVGTTFGRSGVLPPGVSSWLANAMFMTAAAVILYRMQHRK